MRSRPDVEEVVWFGNPEVREKCGRHTDVIVLSGMDEALLDSAPSEFSEDRRDFEEVRSRASNYKYWASAF